MEMILKSPSVQYGCLGLAFILTTGFIKAFFQILSQWQRQENELFLHHKERERAFTEQFLACIDRNSAALEKVEQGLQQIRLELARAEGGLVLMEDQAITK